jgi:anhydro-N-acetylmuramic acid kinase
MTGLFIGLMSGTSLDGVDGILVSFEAEHPKVLAFCSLDFPHDLKANFLALNAPGADELHRAALAGNGLARLYASAVAELLRLAGVAAHQVSAVGAHGQTVRHRPGEFDGTGYTLQVNQPALLAELTGIDVIADFRSRDVAAGGQGAPLVPPFHQSIFHHPSLQVAVLNIGGISNVTLLDPMRPEVLIGFDCGPGNALMDTWCTEHTGKPYDAGGSWAASGSVNAELLCVFFHEPFFAKLPPKSTGRDLFNGHWLTSCLSRIAPISANDVQATLAELTALSCARAIQDHLPQCSDLYVCGGGAFNAHLLGRIQAALPATHVATTTAKGVHPQQVEAAAFAWLAQQALLRKTASVKSVTGARGARILGAIYPA